MGDTTLDPRAGSWEETLGGLWRLMAAHAPYAAPGWYADYAKDAQLIYFVGGPWDGRLMWIGSHQYRRGHVLAPEEPKDLISFSSDGMIRPEQVTYRIIDYFADVPLPTGVPVFSCLWGAPRRFSSSR